MKKKIFGFLMLTALCVVTVVKVSVDNNSVTGLTLANVEALANTGEGELDGLDDHQQNEEKNTKCTIKKDGEEIQGIWISCISGNDICHSGCAELR